MQKFYNIIRENPEIWHIFTREEEYSSPVLDQHDRFQFSQSKYKEILKPIVSEYLIKNGFGISYPENKPFCVCLTHDVDEIYPPLQHTFLSSLACCKKFDIDGIKKQIFWRFSNKEKSPYWNFNQIMDIEAKYEAQSSFYFLATDSDIRRFRYKIEDLEGELGSISDQGCEVGLHGGYYAYDNLEEVLKEKHRLEKVLEKKIIGFRNHYLRFKVPNSWVLLAKAGFEYDSTLAYSEILGFRNGMCHPFFPYDLTTGTYENIIELPLSMMDSTLFSISKTFVDAWHHAEQCINIVEKYQGVLVINWHSNSFNCAYKRQWQKLYEKILDHCYQKNAWMTNGQEITNFLKNTNTWYDFRRIL